MVKEIVVAEKAGFCFGVKRAVDAIEDALAESGALWSIGMPIHNLQEVTRLRAMGLKVAENVDEVPGEARVLIRAHGESKAVMEVLAARGTQIIDTTCPFVHRAQKYVEEFSSLGYAVVLLGDGRHPEIRAMMGYAKESIDVVESAEEAERLPKRPRVVLISQTTQREDLLTSVAATLIPRVGELHVCNTICRATLERQSAVRRLVGKVNGLLLIGGRNSANTAKLRDIAEAGGLDVLWIETPSELGRGWFEGKNRIGVAAGASTPQWLINEICSEIARM
ncbi:MAG: 4-hydroxy-3-methylbut-2-enyl diphosphate reductase [Synergistaceae bacterium]|jgi:4-hydroxy-3-methylbut-2-enyl diphosphate reductase|nr:4-hydroxy-3-methylbut-2-enyl diphosphate reductase [Synergistaceae bacterium]